MSTSLQDIKSKKFYVALLAEFLGTLLLVLVACGSCVAPDTNVVRIALSFGLSVASIVWAICNVSGGHINPAVTIGFLVTRKISFVRSILYIVFQCLGAIVGAGLLKALMVLPENSTLGTSSPSSDDYNAGQIFGIELVLAFVLVFVVFGTCDSNRRDLSGSGPLAIGLSIAMCHLWAANISGAGMNPARVFGPAIIAGHWKFHWAYWVGPLVGGALAAIIYDFVFAVNATPAKVRGFFTRDYDDANYDNAGRRVGAANGQELKATA